MSIYIGKHFKYVAIGTGIVFLLYNLFFSEYFDLIYTLGSYTAFMGAFTWGYLSPKR